MKAATLTLRMFTVLSPHARDRPNQATSQMTDESGQSYPSTVNTLLDRALGPLGYYGAFVANMHTDLIQSAGSDAIVASAKARQVPVISARQLLEWLDGRNNSAFGSLAWDGARLSFTVSVAHDGGEALMRARPGSIRLFIW